MKGYFYLTALVLLASCSLKNKSKDKSWNELPGVTRLASLKQTEFVTTLENPILQEKNSIYSPAFLFAWDKIEEELKSPIQLDENNSGDFKLLVNSRSHINSLTGSEFSTSVTVKNGKIIARAFLNKTLPFETRLQVLYDSIVFNKETKVMSFGIDHFNEDAVKFTNILYYLNDDNFILRLIPKDKQHEIILVKTLPYYKTLADALFLTNSLIEKGKRESKDIKQSWKYEIGEIDKFSIPVVKFNIATNYRNLEGQQLATKNNDKLVIEEAYQRTGFILNENGAVVESEAAAAAAAADTAIIRYPKNMILDKPFLIVVKQRKQKNPYFVMAVNNTELMSAKP